VVDRFTWLVADSFPQFVFTYAAVQVLSGVNGAIGKDKLRETVADRTRKTVNDVKRVLTHRWAFPCFGVSSNDDGCGPRRL